MYFFSQLDSSFSIDISSCFLSVGAGRQYYVRIIGSLIPVSSLINHKSIFRDVLRSDIVTAQDVNKFRFGKIKRFLRETQVKCAHTRGFFVQDIETVPAQRFVNY